MMKPSKVKSSLRTKTGSRKRHSVVFNTESEEIKPGEFWFGYATDSYYDQKTKREMIRERHHKLTEDLRSELSLVQKEMEDNSLGLASDLQNKIDADLQLIDSKCQLINDIQVGPDLKSNLDTIWQEARKISWRRQRATLSFHKMLIEIEENRLKRVTAILDKFQELFVKNNYLDRKEIKDFFDFELMTVNNEKLKNVSNYGELKERYNQSTAQHINSLKLLSIQKINSWHELLESGLKSKLKLALKLDLSQTFFDSKELNDLQQLFENKLKEFHERWNPSEMMFTNQKTLLSWFESVESILDSLDYIARDILEQCETVLKLQYTDCEASVKNAKECVENKLFSPDEETEERFKQTIHPLLKSLKDHTDAIVDDLKAEWGRLIFNLLEEIDSIKIIFSAAEDFKIKYSESLTTLQTRYFHQLLAEEKSFTSPSQKEGNDNADNLISRVKVALNVQILNTVMEEIRDIYEGKKSRLRDSYNKTVRILDNFLEDLKTDFSRIRDEIKTIVSLHKDNKNYSNLISISGTSNGFPVFLITMQNEFAAVQDSKPRILALLLNEFSSKLENDCAEKANVWILSKRQTIRKEFEEKLSSLSSQWDCFRNTVYTPRVQVLREHADYFEKHKELVMQFWPETKLETHTFHAKLNDMNQKSNAWIETMQKRIGAIYGSSDVQVILSEVIKEEEGLKRALRYLTDEYIQILSTKEEEIVNGNFVFVQNLLTLAEQNSYTNEEISIFSEELFKLEKLVNSEREKLKADAVNERRIVLDDIKQRLSVLIESLHLTEADLVFSETVIHFIRESKTELKKCAFSLKRSGKSLHRQIEELQQVANKNILWPDSAETVVFNQWKSLLESLKSRKVLLSNDSEGNEMKVDESVEEEIFPSYVSKLLYFSCSNTSFLYKIYDVLRKSLERIEEIAKDYYMNNSRSRKSTIPEQLHETYNDLMTEIIHKYNSYTQQCQMEWFTQLCDFVDAITLLKEGVTSYIARYVSNLATVSIDTMEEYNRHALGKLKMIQDHGVNRIQEISTFLKPSHGHPNNENTLNDLQAQFDTICRKYEEMSGETVRKYEITGKDIADKGRSDLSIKKKKLESVFHDIFVKDTLQSIIQAMLEECEKLLVRQSSVYTVECQNDDLKHDNESTGSPIQTSVLRGFETNYSGIDKCRIDSIKLKLITLTHQDCEVFRKHFLQTLENPINECLEDLQAKYVQTCRELQRIDHAFKSNIKEARFEWDINIHSIQGIFTFPVSE